MTRRYVLFFLLPLVFLLGIAGTLASAAYVLNNLSEQVPAGQAEFVEKLQRNEHSLDHLREFATVTLNADEAAKSMYGNLADLLFALAGGIILAAAYFAYGAYQLQKAQQGAPADRPGPAGSASG